MIKYDGMKRTGKNSDHGLLQGTIPVFAWGIDEPTESCSRWRRVY
jgi:hypothetical protein